MYAKENQKNDPRVKNGVYLSTGHLFMLTNIRALAKRTTYCYATNQALGAMQGIGKSRASHIITDLAQAGLVVVVQNMDPVTRMTIRRDIIPTPKRIYDHLPEPSPERDAMFGEFTAALLGYKEEMDKRKEECTQRARIYHKASMRGINSLDMNRIIFKMDNDGKTPKWTLDYIEEKLDILLASRTAVAPLRYLYAALNGDFKPGKAAQKMAKAERIPRRLTPEDVHYDPMPLTEVYRKLQKKSSYDAAVELGITSKRVLALCKKKDREREENRLF